MRDKAGRCYFFFFFLGGPGQAGRQAKKKKILGFNEALEWKQPQV